MTCDELMAVLLDYLGGDLVVGHRETVEIHIRGCARCESYVATYTHTTRLVRALPKCGSLPPAMEARLRRVLEAELGE